MKPSEDIEKRIKNVNIVINPEMNKKVFSNILQAFKKTNSQGSAVSQPNIWRIIMKSPISKLAVAAVVIIAVMIGISHFSGSLDGAAVAYGEMINAIEEMPWMHTYGYIRGEEDVKHESWWGFSRRIQANINTRFGTRHCRFHDYNTGELYSYDSGSGTIYIYPYIKGFAVDAPGAQSPVYYFRQWLEQIKKIIDGTDGYKVRTFQGRKIKAKISRKVDLYNGQKVEVYELVLPHMNKDKNIVERVSEVKFVTDFKNHLPIFLGGKDIYPNREEVHEYFFDFPEEGPEDIYALGVPRTAKIMDEASLLNALQVFADLNGGKYPSDLKDLMKEFNAAYKVKYGTSANTDDDERYKNFKALMLRALDFYGKLTTEEGKDVAYYGGVTANDANTVLMRWKVRDDVYMVIDGWLSRRVVSAEKLDRWESVGIRP
jgi:hypothetical protein